MSDLQLALLLIGILVVAGVLIFNWSQERRFRKQAAAAFQVPERDALLERAVPRTNTERIEPGLREPARDNGVAYPPPDASGPRLADSSPHPKPVPPTGAHRPAPREAKSDRGDVVADDLNLPEVADAAPAIALARPPETAPKPVARPVVVPPAPYDELIEYRISIEGEGMNTALFADDINRMRSMNKFTRWLGFPVGGSDWEEIQPWREAQYRKVQATLQLADRNGAVHENDLSGLCAILQATARTHGLTIACDDVAEALERAQSVDRFCVDVDVLIGLNVVARGEGAMPISKILREAEHTGMVLGVDGTYQLLDSRDESLYVLCNHDAEPFSSESADQHTQAVTLQFDVPRVPDGLKVFDSMVGFGRKLANDVGGLLVDDNMRPLTDSGIEKIRQQLAGIYQRMEARGVPSGSRRALRLFS